MKFKVSVLISLIALLCFTSRYLNASHFNFFDCGSFDKFSSWEKPAFSHTNIWDDLVRQNITGDLLDELNKTNFLAELNPATCDLLGGISAYTDAISAHDFEKNDLLLHEVRKSCTGDLFEKLNSTSTSSPSPYDADHSDSLRPTQDIQELFEGEFDALIRYESPHDLEIYLAAEKDQYEFLRTNHGDTSEFYLDLCTNVRGDGFKESSIDLKGNEIFIPSLLRSLKSGSSSIEPHKSEPCQDYLYIMDSDGEVHYLPNLKMRSENDDFRHHDLSKNADVRCAGTISTDRFGKIIEISNHSGHFEPSVQHLVECVKLMLSRGNLDESCTVLFYNNEDGNRDSLLNFIEKFDDKMAPLKWEMNKKSHFWLDKLKITFENNPQLKDQLMNMGIDLYSLHDRLQNLISHAEKYGNQMERMKKDISFSQSKFDTTKESFEMEKYAFDRKINLIKNIVMKEQKRLQDERVQEYRHKLRESIFEDF